MALGGVLRFDLGSLRPARRMSDGRLCADAHITRAGVFEYLDEQGKVRRELRPPEEVFSPESMASFSQVPVTNDHPPVGLLNAKNARHYMVGSTGESVVRDDSHVRTQLMVADADTIRQMEAGKREVSCGYSCDLDETPGHHPVFGRYDAIQRNIRGNHVAIVEAARAGKTARVRLDGATSAPRGHYVPNAAPTRRGDDMDPEKLQETIRALGAQLTEEKARADAAEEKLKEHQSRADVAEGRLKTVEKERDELRTQVTLRQDAVDTDALKREKERADTAEQKIARFDATLERRVRERAKLERQAAAVMGPSFRMDDMGDREIMSAVVQRLDAEADVSAGVPDGIIQGRFLALTEGHSRNARAQAHVAEIIGETRDQAPRVDSKEEQKRRLRDQWKQPLPNDIRARKEA